MEEGRNIFLHRLGTEFWKSTHCSRGIRAKHQRGLDSKCQTFRRCWLIWAALLPLRSLPNGGFGHWFVTRMVEPSSYTNRSVNLDFILVALDVCLLQRVS